MYNDIITEERIDNYLLGRMSDEEKRLFEDELEKNAELREEYECQKQVANAVQKVAMRDFLTKHAEERQQQKDNVVDLSEVFGRIAGRVKEYFSYGQRTVWALASVAAMVVAVVGGINYSSTLHSMQDNGMLAYAELSVPVSRGGDDLDAMIENAFNLIGSGELDQALKVIGESKTKALEILAQPIETDEDDYEHQILQQKMYDLEWYETIVMMRQGKVIKANKALKVIASSSSPYAEMAKSFLNNQ